jgi:hypothetical protein
MNQKNWIQEYIKLHIAKTAVFQRIIRYKNYCSFFNDDKIQYIYIVYDPKINKHEGEQIKAFETDIDVDMIGTLALALHCPNTLHILMLFYLNAPNTYHLNEHPRKQLFLHQKHSYFLPDLL